MTDERTARIDDDRWIRKGLGLRAEVKDRIEGDYRSDLVQRFRENGFALRVGDVTFRLAKEFGFCYGVDRAVDYAYETVAKFPDRRVVLTGEIIHNPAVNARLREMGIRFVGDPEVPSLASIGEGDVVLLPAFGVAAPDFDALRRSGAVLVDTTCGSVLNVWKNVERFAKDGFTSLVHGKWRHEETKATCSRAVVSGGAYLVVLDLAEADAVADYVRRGGDRAAFLARFRDAASPGFDPDRDLQRIGVANQTTMLSSESLEIARRIGRALADRHGAAELPSRFRSFDTICSATQDRQDALAALIREPLDLLLVIGGFNSSNTGHLVEMAEGHVPAYHVRGPEDLLSKDAIRHRPPGGASRHGSSAPPEGSAAETVDTRGWLPSRRPLTVGLTAGASTPDGMVGAVVERVLALLGLEAPRPAGAPVGARS